MSWNYRIIEFEDHRALHEVHYDAEKRPESYTENPVHFSSSVDESDEEIICDLELALKDARRLPVLAVGVFDLPIAERPVCPRADYGGEGCVNVS